MSLWRLSATHYFLVEYCVGCDGVRLYYLGLLRPALVVAQRTMDEVIVMAKTKLREVLIDDHGVGAPVE